MNTRRRATLAGLVTVSLLLLGLGAALVTRHTAAPRDADTTREPTTDAAPAAAPQRTPRTPPLPTGATAAAPTAATPDAPQRALWRQRLERAQRTLDSYVAHTRYPPTSRPASEHPDQLAPAEPERTLPLGDGASRVGAGVRLRVKQDRVYLAGEDAVHLTVACEGEQGQPVGCLVTDGAVGDPATPAAAVPLPFRDDGRDGDARAGDGVSTARLVPAKAGFGMFHGTLRARFRVRSGEQEGGGFFDVVYTPHAPARFTGRVREALERGSLVLALGVQVRTAGRYVVTGRVDDADGQPFALVTFNEALEAGAQEVPLVVFGRLVHDGKPAFPLRLRDVEAFLLLEDQDPDRQLLSPLRGPVHQTREYAADAFSPDAYAGEERTRYVQELQADVERARAGAEGRP